MRKEDNQDRNERRYKSRRTRSWLRNALSYYVGSRGLQLERVQVRKAGSKKTFYYVTIRDTEADPLRNLLDRECDSIVKSALNQLNAAERWAVTEYFVEGRSLRDLLRENSRSADLVKLGRRKLQARLQHLNLCHN